MPTKKKMIAKSKNLKVKPAKAKSKKTIAKSAADKAPKVNWKARAEELTDYANTLEVSVAFYASQATHDVVQELRREQRAHPSPILTAQDGFVLLEDEMLDLFEAVEANSESNGSVENVTMSQMRLNTVREKSIRVAATALRFIREVCDKDYVN